MKRIAAVLLALACLPSVASGATSPAALADTLSFEFADSTGAPAGWTFGPPAPRWDTTAPHGGRASARIDRDSTSSRDFSAFSRSLPADFAGDTLEIRGWIRTANVQGFAGFWLREDASGGHVQFDNMEERGLTGTTPWTEYRVALPLDRRARTIVYGALLVGTGSAWVDDVRLLVDGKPVADAPRVVRKPPAAETDREFDEGSRLDAAALLSAPAENLVLLGKVWGFLKYHHPRVSGGGHHWDYELFRVLPAVAKARTRADAARAIVRWIDRVGMPPACKPCAQAPDSTALEPPIAWIHDRGRLTRDLSSRLERVYRDRAVPEDPYYAAVLPLGNADFSRENNYRKHESPDAGYRMLALFRFWNMIEYWFPYRDLLKEDWDAVLAEFVPRLLRAGERDAYKLAIMDLVARVHDGHANVWSSLDVRPPVGGCWLPVAVRPVGDRFVVGTYADSARAAASGFRIGDEILALDGARVDSLARAWTPHYAASNQSTRRRDMARFLTRGPCGACRVTIDRGAGAQEVAAVRDSLRPAELLRGVTHDLPGETFRLLNEEVAYLKLSTVASAEAASYVKRAAGTRCLVIDIRNYPKEFMVFALGSRLVDRPTPFARFTTADRENPGAFRWTSPVALEPQEPRYAGKVVILVDETSQSQAEYTAMGFRSAPGAIVVGSTTAGADGNVSAIPLPGGLRAMISGIGVFYPDKRPTQQIGIVPDLVVHPTIEGIRAGRDEVLEAALEAALGRAVQIPVQP